jgi:hypothetical protein
VSLNWRGDVGDGEVGRGEERPRGLRPMRAREGERPGAELGREHARHVPRGVAESCGESRHSFALDHSVVHEAHRARREVVAQVPLR